MIECVVSTLHESIECILSFQDVKCVYFLHKLVGGYSITLSQNSVVTYMNQQINKQGRYASMRKH